MLIALTVISLTHVTLYMLGYSPAGSSGSGKRDNISALACCSDLRYSILYLYACRINAHRCILNTGNVSTAVCGHTIVTNGL